MAAICVLLQLCTVAGLVPSHTLPIPCTDPKPEPEIVTCVPAVPPDGDTLVMLGVAGMAWTVTDVVAEVAPDVAVMVAVPAVPPVVAKPPAPIEITAELEELHVTDAVTSCVLPSENVPVALNCSVDSACSDGFEGVMAIETNVATLRLEDPPRSPAVALITGVPAVRALTRPAEPDELVTTAVEGFEEVQMTDWSIWVLPPLNVPVATNC